MPEWMNMRRCVDGRMDGKGMNGWIDAWMDGWMNEWKTMRKRRWPENIDTLKKTYMHRSRQVGRGGDNRKFETQLTRHPCIDDGLTPLNG